MATVSNSRDQELDGDDEVSSDQFATQLAALVFGRQALRAQRSPAGRAELWMSRARPGEPASVRA
jgi:hypothetical protein